MAIINRETGEVKYEGMVVALRERNGYDDSDFYATVWTGTSAFEVEYATTRFYTHHISASVDASPEAMASYQGWLREKCAREAAEREAARRAAPEPHDLRVGAKVVTLRDAKYQVSSEVPCERCKGAGCWVNPRNASDRRPCFGCNGSGSVKGAKLKGDNGKPVWGKVSQGTTGEIVTWRTYGTIYRNGYNQPNRYNTTVQVKLEDGRVVPVKLEALALA